MLGLPMPLPDELDRPRLLDRIGGRWSQPVTVLVAGAGFGKSTLLSQAARANALEPRGVDVWHSCAPGDEDADVLCDSVLSALGAEGRHPDRVASLFDALAAYSPIDVCLLLDDAHVLVPGSSGAELISQLVRRLPANAHLVLAARHRPPGALSRLLASGRILEVTENDLAFTPEEVSRLASRVGCGPEAASALGGWPALVRLTLAVRPDVAWTFAREEVLTGLSGRERRALFVLSNLGYADQELVGQVVGFDVDLGDLSATVPLISRTSAGLFRAHDLWSAALLHSLDRDESAELRSRVVRQLIARGDLARAGSIAVAHRDMDALQHVALELVSRTVSILPLDIVRPWSRVLEQARPDAPETRLMLAAIHQALDFTDASADAEIDAAAEGFHAIGHTDGEIAALAVGTVGAHSRGDTERILALARRAGAIPGSQDHPVVNLAVHSIAAVVAEMSGDPDRALQELRLAGLDRVPGAIGTATRRFLIHCLLLTGQADEAAEVAQRLLETSNTTIVRYMPAFARWMAGDPTDLTALGGPPLHELGLTSRDEFVRRTLVGYVMACAGRCHDLRRLVEGTDGDGGERGHPGNPRDAALGAIAEALCAVLDHDDDRAARLIGRLLADHGGSPILDQHLRRYLPIGFVVDATLRARWESTILGPSQHKARAISRLLLDLRAGHRVGPCDLDPARVFTALPLPWSIEMACRLHANRHPAGAQLATWLIDQVAEPARAELRHLAQSASGPAAARVARAATDLLAHLPALPPQRLEISVLGPLRVAFDGIEVPASALRRARVRALLSLLVVHRTLSRERAIDLLWPRLGAVDGARNLRVTLTYLRQLIEPQRPVGQAPFHLRTDRATVSLHSSAHLTVDLWELQRLAREATVSREQGDPDRTIELLAAATSMWRGEPLLDLESTLDQEAEVEHTRLLYLDSRLELGERRLARGRPAEASIDAERALTLDPYSQRIHRLAIAAALHGHDRARTTIVVERALERLGELGVEPEPATQILLRQAC